MLTCAYFVYVSTHSRLKAAGNHKTNPNPTKKGFNTQPPEGGWPAVGTQFDFNGAFQHTAA